MTCLTTSTVEGCFNGQTVLIQLSNDGKGKPAIRYTDVAGDVIAGATAANVTVGACVRKQPSYRKICAMMDLSGTPTKVNILEVSTPQADGTTVTTYLDPHVSPMVDVTAQFISFENDGKCPCTINGTIPTADVVDVLAGSLGTIAGTTRSATAAFTGAPATVNTSGITGKLQSITISAKGVTDGIASADSVTVTLANGQTIKLFDNQSIGWAVTRDQDDEVLDPITVTATGNAYANIAYTAV